MADAQRSPLSRALVAATALELIDRHGLSGLSMRKLGAELGVEAMSLYHHVRNKDDLLAAVTELLAAEVVAGYEPDLGGSWRDDAWAIVSAYRAMALRHPAAFTLLSDRAPATPTGAEILAAVISVFNTAGFDERTAPLAVDAAASWTIGCIRQEVTARQHQSTAVGAPTASSDDDARFSFGFDILIRGFEAALTENDGGLTSLDAASGHR